MTFLLKLIKFGFFLIGSLSVIFIIGAFILVIINALFNQNPSVINQQSAEQQIECFINGISIMTTRENCQKLSIQKTQEPPVVNVQQPRPIIQVPQLQFPKTTNCTYNRGGYIMGDSIDCITY